MLFKYSTGSSLLDSSISFHYSIVIHSPSHSFLKRKEKHLCRYWPAVAPFSFLPKPPLQTCQVLLRLSLQGPHLRAIVEMGWPSRTGQAVVAVASLLTLVNGQGYLSTVEGELAKCTSDNFVFLGCYKGFEPTGEPYFRFSPAVYEPNGDPSRSFPKYNPGSDYDDTTTPLNCARVCRGYGYKFSSLANNNCRCGSQIPPVLVTTGATCNEQCHGDATLTCGGFQDAGIWLDPTFADPSVVPIVDQNVGLATSYQHLGCYYQPDFPTQDPRASQPRLGMDNCLAYCAGLGYPLVYARSIAASDNIQSD